MKIWLDLAEILRIRKLDWRDGGEKKEGRRGGILLCNGLIILRYPQEYTLKISWRSDMIWLRCIGSKNVYLFVCLFIDLSVFVLIIVGHPQKAPPKILGRSNLIWLRYLGSKDVYLFVCLFVCLLTCFYINHLGTPTEIYPENIVKIWLDLAEIFRV